MAALATAMAAALVGKAARVSADGWADSAAIAAQADSLRRRVTPLAAADAEAYAQALEAMRAPKADKPERRDFEIQQALARAADVPLQIAEAAADVAELGAVVAKRGNEAVRPEAAAGAVLAEASARVCAHLVEVNLASSADDPRVAKSRQLAESASEAARAALRPA